MSPNEPHRKTCGAKNRKGGRCGSPPVPGRTRCRLHGGASLQGAAAGQFKHGRYSRHMPKAMLERLREASSDPELLSLRQEIAVLDVRTGEIIASLSGAESSTAWMKRLRETWQAFTATKNPSEARILGATVAELIDSGASTADAWDAIARMFHHRRKLVESEMRRQVALQQVVTLEQVTTVFEALRVSVQQHVKDPAALRAIQADLVRLLEVRER